MGKSEAKDVHVLESIDAIRKRPGMYIGSADVKGFHHLVNEVLDNSVDEFLAGNCSQIDISINKDNSITVADDGCGIPVGMHKSGKHAVEVVFTKLHAGAKFGDESSPYKISGGLHGVGVTAVNAMSEELCVLVSRDGGLYEIKFSRGVVVESLKKIKNIPDDVHGTTVTFKPDSTIFKKLRFDYDIISNRCRELSYLNPRLQIKLFDSRDNKKEEFYTEDGVAEFVEYLNRTKNGILPRYPIQFSGIVELTKNTEMQFDVAFQYNSDDGGRIESYCNNIHTEDGGTHVIGFKQALTSMFNIYCRQNNILGQKEPIPDGKDYRDGLIAVVSIRHPNPSFESQTKVKLVNPEVAPLIVSAISTKLKYYFEGDPDNTIKIIKKASISAKARISAKKAADKIKRKDLTFKMGLPGKLADCLSRSNEETELFIVEGDSAGGSAKVGRNSTFQAILALRGKILNVEKASSSKVYNHKEIKHIVKAVGTGVKNDYNDNKRRYGNIIIMTDADIDGSHIRTLLLTFFFRYMPRIIEDGRLYAAAPPLFKFVNKKTKKTRYINSYKQKMELLVGWGLNNINQINIDGVIYDDFKDLATNLVLFDDIRQRLLGSSISLNEYIRYGVPEYLLADTDEIMPVYSIEEYDDDISNLRDFTQISGEVQSVIQALNEYNIDYHNILGGNLTIFTNKGVDIHCRSVADLIRGILDVGAKDIQISRFKGLGEMDAKELWETTMNPSTRCLHQITIDDAEAADNIFSILMGDDVAPRREYIKVNAPKVKNLDI